MTAEIIGDPFAPRAEEGQPDVKFDMSCEHCGETVRVVMTWEKARQFAAQLNHQIAAAMRDLPRTEGPFLGRRA